MQVRKKEQSPPLVQDFLTDEQKADLTLVEDFVKDGLEARRPYEIYWYRNMAFFLGYQYITWDNYKGTLRVPMAPSWRVRYVDNRIKPNAMHTVAKLAKNRAVFTTVPKKIQDDLATNSSEIAKKILMHIQQLNHVDNQQQILFLLMYLYGHAYKMLFWDVEGGEPIAYIPLDKDGKKGQMLYTGDVSQMILSPFQVIHETGATNIKDCQRICLMYSKPIDYIKRRFEWGKYVEAEATQNNSSMEKQLISLMSHTFMNQGDSSNVDGIMGSKEDKRKTGFATIKELREKPSSDYPRGRIIRYANGILLEPSQELPEEFMVKYRNFGVQKYDYVELHERWEGETPVNDQIPIQMKINRTQSAIQEIENEMAKPKWMVHTLSGITKTQIDNEPGEVIEHSTPIGYDPPHPIPGVEIPVSMFKSIENDERVMENASNIHETSKGMAVPGVESKVAMQFLQEQDQTIYAPVLNRTETLDAEFYTWALDLAKRHYKEPRLLQILGPNNEIEVLDFQGTEDFPTTVRPIPGSSLPTSLAAKQQSILNFFSQGAFGPIDQIPEDLRMRILTAAEIGDVDTVYREMKVDYREARREHRLWERGIVSPIEPFDNHQVHLRQHDLFRKSDLYRLIQRNKPQLAMAIDDHIVQHIQMDPVFQQNQAMQQDQEEAKEIARQDKALERAEKEAQIKGKIAERKLALRKGLSPEKPTISDEQTVKE